jgi:hypothetical protein
MTSRFFYYDCQLVYGIGKPTVNAKNGCAEVVFAYSIDYFILQFQVV